MIISPMSIVGRPGPGFHFLDDISVPYEKCRHDTGRCKEGKKYYIVTVRGEDFDLKLQRDWNNKNVRIPFVDEECKRGYCRVIAFGQNYWEKKLHSVVLEIEVTEGSYRFNEYEMEILRKTHCDEPILTRWEILDL